MIRFYTNQITAKVTRRSHHGREYLVAPAVAVREQVLNGEFLPADEIAAFVEAWNGIPLVIDHPREDGREISANNPDIPIVGRFWHAEMYGTKLKGEMWFDLTALAAAGEVGHLIRHKLERGELIELSTAYFRDLEDKSGIHNGQRYKGIQRNLRPDHLAVLPHDTGACSIKDGCGVPRTNTTRKSPFFTSKGGSMKINEFLTLIGKRVGLKVNLDEKTDGNLLSAEITVEEEETEEEKLKQAKADAEAAAPPEPVETTPATKSGAAEPTATQTPAPVGPPEAAPAPEMAQLTEMVGNLTTQLAGLSKNVETLMTNHKAAEDLEKERLVSGLAANALCPIAEGDLKGMPIEVLQTLARSYQVSDYSGRGSFNPPVTNQDLIAIPAPVLFALPETSKKEN